MPKLDSPKLDDNPTDNMMASIEGLWDTANSAVQADLKKRVNKKTRKKSAEPAPPVEASSASGTPSTDDEAISRLKDMGNLRSADSGAADAGAPSDLADAGAPSDLADAGAPSDSGDSGAPSDLADAGAPLAPEALFSDAFSKLVQQVVEDYLDKNLAPMISKAVQAELKKKPKTRRKTANKAK